jgi:non-homologous end joining protein Ku
MKMAMTLINKLTKHFIAEDCTTPIPKNSKKLSNKKLKAKSPKAMVKHHRKRKPAI